MLTRLNIGKHGQAPQKKHKNKISGQCLARDRKNPRFEGSILDFVDRHPKKTKKTRFQDNVKPDQVRVDIVLKSWFFCFFWVPVDKIQD